MRRQTVLFFEFNFSHNAVVAFVFEGKVQTLNGLIGTPEIGEDIRLNADLSKDFNGGRTEVMRLDNVFPRDGASNEILFRSVSISKIPAD